MPVSPADIQPVADASAPAPIEPQAAAPAAEPAPEEKSILPEAVLKIPAMNALLQGSPPATYAPLKSKTPEIETLSKNAEALKKAGFAAFKSESKPGNFIMFNGLAIKPEEVVQADKSGQLDSVAVPFDQLLQSFEQARNDAQPTDGEGAPASQAPPGGAIAPAGASEVPPLPAGAQKRTMAARVANLVPGGPTSGPAPGRGRILNAISTPVV